MLCPVLSRFGVLVAWLVVLSGVASAPVKSDQEMMPHNLIGGS
jgi:hypothetical protein